MQMVAPYTDAISDAAIMNAPACSCAQAAMRGIKDNQQIVNHFFGEMTQ